VGAEPSSQFARAKMAANYFFISLPFHTITDHADQLTTSRLRRDRSFVSLYDVHLPGGGNASLDRAVR
jgi:hypothetical protein